MRRKQLLIAFMYLCLIAGCLGVVVFVRYLNGNKEFKEPLPTEATLQPSGEDMKPEDKKPAATPSDAETMEGSEQNKTTWKEAYHYWYWEAPQEDEPELETPYQPPAIMLASDLHYMSEKMHDDGKAFQKMEAEDDGKVNRYSDVVIDTLLAEAVRTAPSALVLAGDNTHNGELTNHLELAEKLKRVQEAGVQVLIIPGNHDIYNENAATYFGDLKEEAEYLADAEAFLEIFHSFGYDQALSRDAASLSYIYALDENYWMLMIDSCQYEDYNHVNGRIKPATMEWMTEQLDLAAEQEIAVLPVAHHNLLSESRLYTTECTLENHLEVVGLLEEYELPLYISGHLHAQRIKKHKSEPSVPDEAYGITEIVLSPYCLSPNQYGYLAWDLTGSMSFESRRADVGAYARKIGSEDENLLNFPEYGINYLKTVIKEQVLLTIHSVPDDIREEMAQLYADLYFSYCAGNRMVQDAVVSERSYKLWQRVDPDSKYVKKMGQMMEDVKDDHHDWSRIITAPEEAEEDEYETADDWSGSVIR